jgi:hypothetical protein
MSASRLFVLAVGLVALTGCGATSASSAYSPSGWIASPSSGPQGNTPTTSERPHAERASSSGGHGHDRGYGARGRH